MIVLQVEHRPRPPLRQAQTGRTSRSVLRKSPSRLRQIEISGGDLAAVAPGRLSQRLQEQPPDDALGFLSPALTL